MSDDGWAPPGGPPWRPADPSEPLPPPPPGYGPPTPAEQAFAPPPFGVPPGSQQPYPQQAYPQQAYPQPGYAPGWGPAGPAPVGHPAPWPAATARRRPAAADRPRPYPQLLRGPDHRWWRPIASVALATACLVALVIGAAVAAFAAAVVMSGTPALDTLAGRLDEEAFYSTPVGFLVNNLLLAALIPAAMVAVWVVHRWRPRWVASVRPGLRWGWMLECTAWSLVFVGGLFVAGLLVDGPIDVDPEQQALAFVVVIALTTPLQAAGEEYGFRGLLTQAIGSWFARPVLGAVVAGAVTATLFALAHGSQSPWLFADRFAFGAVASYLVWRTGGLEAGIALHTVNNLYAIGVSVLTGTLAESLTATDYPAVAAILDVVLMLALAAALTWRAHRRGLARVHDPAAQPDRFRGRPPQVAWAAYRG